MPKHDDYDTLFQLLLIYYACRMALAVVRKPSDSQMKHRKIGKCDVNVGTTVWLDLQVSQNNLLLTRIDLIDLSLMGGCGGIFLFIFFLINWAVVKAFHIHGNYPAWSCLILCMLLILEHAMECSSFDLLVLRAYILFNFFEFPVRMCTIFKKRTAVKEPFDITENSVLFCRYWLKDPFCLW